VAVVVLAWPFITITITIALRPGTSRPGGATKRYPIEWLRGLSHSGMGR